LKPELQYMKEIVIIGNGIAGITAARHIRKRSDHRIIVISAETDHFFSRTALMYVYMGHMKYKHIKPYEDWFWDKNRIELLRDHVEKVDFINKKLHLQKGGSVSYDQLILATGSKSNFFDWPGQDLTGVQGLFSYQDLEKMEANTVNVKEAVVVGGGLIGIEMAEMLLSRNIKVTFLVRETSFWNNVLPQEESEMINRHILRRHVDLKLETELKAIKGNEYGRVTDVVTNNDEHIPCQFVGITVGVHPNVGFLRNTNLEIDKGILVDDYLQTNIPDVFAIGDCAQVRNPKAGRKPIEPVWYTGRIMGHTLAKTLTGEKNPYNPGNWFNSAKFFDIEYQVYGEIKNNPDETVDHLFWMHKDGEKSIRIAFDKKSRRVLGFNLMGVRYRHEICDQWINEEARIEEILPDLKAANFDPEFYSVYEKALVEQFNKRFPEHQVTLKTKRGLFSTFFN
jgi:NADPH-dependent 2,4-dienoyl-CoA reductase/sulfur reductase-like enzyme